EGGQHVIGRQPEARRRQPQVAAIRVEDRVRPFRDGLVALDHVVARDERWLGTAVKPEMSGLWHSLSWCVPIYRKPGRSAVRERALARAARLLRRARHTPRPADRDGAAPARCVLPDERVEAEPR